MEVDAARGLVGPPRRSLDPWKPQHLVDAPVGIVAGGKVGDLQVQPGGDAILHRLTR